MGISRLLRASWFALACLAVLGAAPSAQAQTNFDRPGGDYENMPIASGDPQDCALKCEHDRRCRAWSFAYPTDVVSRAMCWLKNTVPPRVADDCCVSGVRGAGVVDLRKGGIETSIDRAGGDYRTFVLKMGEGYEACKASCTADNKCRAWSYARPGYVGKEAHCYLKKEIKPPRRRAGFISGVVR
jgi:hypothetical protein